MANQNLHRGSPGSPRYWKNIIPSNYTIFDREGVTISGSGEIEEISEASSQAWIGQNEYGNTYYYPVLPKLNRLGSIDESLGYQEDNIPFSDREQKDWDSNILLPANNPLFQHREMEIDLDVTESEEGSIRDSSSGKEGYGIFIGDYKVKFRLDEKPEKEEDLRLPKLSKQSQKGAQ